MLIEVHEVSHILTIIKKDKQLQQKVFVFSEEKITDDYRLQTIYLASIILFKWNFCYPALIYYYQQPRKFAEKSNRQNGD